MAAKNPTPTALNTTPDDSGEIRGYPGGESEPPQVTEVAVPLRYRHGGRELSFFSMTAVIGAPMDITVGELALESFYPADQATAEALREPSKP